MSSNLHVNREKKGIKLYIILLLIKLKLNLILTLSCISQIKFDL